MGKPPTASLWFMMPRQWQVRNQSQPVVQQRHHRLQIIFHDHHDTNTAEPTMSCIRLIIQPNNSSEYKLYFPSHVSMKALRSYGSFTKINSSSLLCKCMQHQCLIRSKSIRFIESRWCVRRFYHVLLLNAAPWLALQWAVMHLILCWLWGMCSYHEKARSHRLQPS